MAMNNSTQGGDAKIILSFTYSNGWAGQIEVPNVSAANLGGKLAAITQALEQAGCRPAPVAATPAPAAPVSNEPPICKYHGPMKPSKKHGGWYCPQKMGDGSFCQEKVEG